MTRADVQLNRRVINNLLWFIASLGLAIFIWLIAATQADPIVTEEFERVPVVADPVPGLQVVSTIEPVTVTVRAPESVLRVLRENEILVTADLEGLGAGTHNNVELDVDIPRHRAIGDPSPLAISVSLEEIQTKLVDVEADVTNNLPLDYERGDIIIEDLQAEVTGAASAVATVASAEIRVNLRNQRNTFEDEYEVVPVDANGVEVQNVEIDPATTTAIVTINQSNDVRPISIVPDIDADSLPEGYNFVDLEYTPQSIFVRGDIEEMPDVLYTQPIDLSDRTDDFEIRVPVISPGDDFLILGDRSVTVSVSIEPAITITREFDPVPVTTIGENERYVTQVATESVVVRITGPEIEVEALELNDIRVVIDLTGLEPGTYDLEPIVTTDPGDVQVDNISVLPATITVTISEPAEATPEP